MDFDQHRLGCRIEHAGGARHAALKGAARKLTDGQLRDHAGVNEWRVRLRHLDNDAQGSGIGHAEELAAVIGADQRADFAAAGGDDAIERRQHLLKLGAAAQALDIGIDGAFAFLGRFDRGLSGGAFGGADVAHGQLVVEFLLGENALRNEALGALEHRFGELQIGIGADEGGHGGAARGLELVVAILRLAELLVQLGSIDFD